ncbi:prenyltransferase/squalene oxidase repeat-containing protein [Tautonia plasticadhaerens]|uniref:Prenyltransferase and squalene oxidase repeat protein n=1 Tax=Tautonia plasticadhaerens TaxID=2527974 RepID=A0A518H9H9_9BACT|nr:prenyltransferase/squalene oxidase repeat-containing protein [Tautonia plasticadhaerens]QDV37503.1 Prenyltransferase and squalene oxidase repeat protein [Tautonia plasticadhaerens]
MFLLMLSAAVASTTTGPEAPEARAVAYLAAEVPRWRGENGCASCHHNGDGARALYRARALGMAVPESGTADSTAWLRRPESWEDNGGDGAFSDTRLARIQFARALAGAIEAGAVGDRSTLDRAARLLAEDQGPDGSWPLDGPDTLGSPATYGWSLATLAARDVLSAADPVRHRPRIDAATAWLRARPIRTVMDASVELLRRDDPGVPGVARRRELALDLLRRSVSSDGGWGPYETSPPEAFDTALAVLALSATGDDQAGRLAGRGREFLIASQLPSGGWVGTTRPSGNESLAQHTSTTAWATLALLETRPTGEETSGD